MLYKAGLTDINIMTAIHAESFSAPDAWGRNVFAQQLVLPGVFGLIHTDGGMILARIAADEAEILTLAVLPPKRRNGIGGILLQEVSTVATSMNARAIYLEVSNENYAARRVYHRIGFAEVGRRPHYYSDNTDALVLRLDIGPVP